MKPTINIPEPAAPVVEPKPKEADVTPELSKPKDEPKSMPAPEPAPEPEPTPSPEPKTEPEPASAPVSESEPAKPEKQTMEIAGGGQVTQSEDGAVLRWR